MLPFDGQDADDGFSSESGQEDDRMERLVLKHRHGRGARNDDPFAFEDGGGFAAESAESTLLDRTLEIRDRSYRLKIERRNGGESRASGAQKKPADEFMGNTVSADEPALAEEGTIGSDAEEFSRNVKEAAEILRKARECMMARDDEEAADALLYRSANLLSTAVALRPTSLAAVGQLGNTYLLHGELKLKISRELRTLLANSGAYLSGRERVARSGKLDRRILNRDNISSALVDVCEECESLLVEAGRSYRMAVSIDSGDVKALYNWGLALTFRGQLLADIGPVWTSTSIKHAQLMLYLSPRNLANSLNVVYHVSIVAMAQTLFHSFSFTMNCEATVPQLTYSNSQKGYNIYIIYKGNGKRIACTLLSYGRLETTYPCHKIIKLFMLNPIKLLHSYPVMLVKREL
jgi:hypothetical protein